MAIPEKDYFYVDEIAERWSQLTGRSVTVSEVLQHGAAGRLDMVSLVRYLFTVPGMQLASDEEFIDDVGNLEAVSPTALLLIEAQYTEKLRQCRNEDEAFVYSPMGPHFRNAVKDLLVSRQARDHFEQKYLRPDEFPKADNSELSPRERANLYRIIGGLALLIIEQQNGKRFGTATQANRSNLIEELRRVLAAVEARTEGTSKSSIYKIIPEDILEALGLPRNSS